MPRRRILDEAVSQMGDPKQVAKELRSFSRSARLLSVDRDSLMERYPKRWIGIYKGAVRADARTFEGLMAALDSAELPRKSVVVQYIDEDERLMIL